MGHRTSFPRGRRKAAPKKRKIILQPDKIIIVIHNDVIHFIRTMSSVTISYYGLCIIKYYDILFWESYFPNSWTVLHFLYFFCVLASVTQACRTRVSRISHGPNWHDTNRPVSETPVRGRNCRVYDGADGHHMTIILRFLSEGIWSSTRFHAKIEGRLRSANSH